MKNALGVLLPFFPEDITSDLTIDIEVSISMDLTDPKQANCRCSLMITWDLQLMVSSVYQI